MESTVSNTRVPAFPVAVSALLGPVSDQDTQTNVLNDGATLNLPDDGTRLMGRRVLPDGKEVGPTKATRQKKVRCKSELLLAPLTPEHSVKRAALKS